MIGMFFIHFLKVDTMCGRVALLGGVWKANKRSFGEWRMSAVMVVVEMEEGTTP